MPRCPWPEGARIRVKTLEEVNKNRDNELDKSFDYFNQRHAGKICKVYFAESRESIKTLFEVPAVRWQRFELVGNQLRIKLLEELKVENEQ